jgi:acetyl esterase/lipase
LTPAVKPVTDAVMSHKSRLRTVILAALIAPVGGCAFPMMLPVALPPGQIEVKTAITFSKPGEETLNLDLARPMVGKGPWPAVVCLYGGGWISGSRAGVRPWLEYLAAHGYLAVAPTYRLAPKYPFPAAVADVRNCVRWLRLHAKEYNIDPDHIGAMGFSAGGHLALMLGVTSDDDHFGPDDISKSGKSARVQAVVNYFGPANLVAKDWSTLAVRSFVIPFLGGDTASHEENARKASPLTYISKDDAPTLTFQGDADLTVSPTQAYELHSRLSLAGLPNELQIMRHQGHGWGEPYLSRSRQDMVRFFDHYLRHIVTRTATATAPG